MSYREFRPRVGLSDLLVCTWERQVPREGAPPAQRVLPDGCIDLVWRRSELLVAGPDSGPYMSPLEPGETVVGLRLRPGVAGRALELPASELLDTRASLRDFWDGDGLELEERVGAADAPTRRREILEEALARRRPGMQAADPLVLAAAGRLGLPGSRVRALSRTLGTSERQLLRRFNVAVGYGPKALDRVLRFQRFASLAPRVAAGEQGLARVAADLGYADQAHLTRECVRLSGLTPARFAQQG